MEATYLLLVLLWRRATITLAQVTLLPVEPLSEPLRLMEPARRVSHLPRSQTYYLHFPYLSSCRIL